MAPKKRVELTHLGPIPYRKQKRAVLKLIGPVRTKPRRAMLTRIGPVRTNPRRAVLEYLGPIPEKKDPVPEKKD